jgi:hypothetical protein
MKLEHLKGVSSVLSSVTSIYTKWILLFKNGQPLTTRELNVNKKSIPVEVSGLELSSPLVLRNGKPNVKELVHPQFIETATRNAFPMYVTPMISLLAFPALIETPSNFYPISRIG